jgi:hypothetical protein
MWRKQFVPRTTIWSKHSRRIAGGRTGDRCCSHLALQYNQLLIQRGVLCFKLALGLAFADSFMGQSEGRACEEPSRSFRSVTD